MHMHAHTEKHTNDGVCARVIAAPASGSSLTHVDCTLEPSGSVCPVHQSAFTEVPGTAPVPASWDRQLKWTHQFNSLLLTDQTAARFVTDCGVLGGEAPSQENTKSIAPRRGNISYHKCSSLLTSEKQILFCLKFEEGPNRTFQTLGDVDDSTQ